MKTMKKIMLLSLLATILLVLSSGACLARPAKGQIAPDFTLVDTDGKSFKLSKHEKGHPLTVLYFFDAASRPSQEGLFSLDRLLKKYQELDLLVLGITTSDKKAALSFAAKVNPKFPVLLDTAKVSEKYGAKGILPTVCILGPQGKVINFIQGGGKTAEIMLTRLAQRTLQRRQSEMAVAISVEAEKVNPKNPEVKVIQGYAALQEGKIAAAEKTFKQLSKQPGKGEILGKEGLSGVYAQKGETQKALALVAEVEMKAPERGYVNKVKGDILYRQNDKVGAKKEFELAVNKKDSEPFQQAVAYNKLGRINASNGDYQQAQTFYDKAIEIDPYYVEATSNKGVAFEKEGKWQKALDSYQEATTLNENDAFSKVLAKKAAEALARQNDNERKKRIDSLVEKLVDRYNKRELALTQETDEWTSRPMVMSFIDFQEKGGLSERDGLSLVLTAQLADLLNSSGRVKVVERAVIDQLLAELNLGSSELSDPDTALRLGRVLAAKLVATGSLFNMPSSTLLSMRFVDTETTAIAKVFTQEIATNTALDQELYQLNRKILKTIIAKYPLRGFVINSKADQVVVNLGSNQGVVVGTAFSVIEEKEAIEYKGKILQGGTETVGQLEVTQVQPDFSYARIVKHTRSFKQDDKIQEVTTNSITVKE